LPRFEGARVTGQILDTDGVRIVYDVIGSGPPVLLLHGGSVDSTWWGPLIPALAEKHTVITMDSRGHGRSSFDGHQITYRRMADDTLALLDQLEIEQIDIVGWSDGAIIALDIALRFPERLGKVVAYGVNFDLSGYRTGEPVQSAAMDLVFAESPKRYREQSPHPERWDEFMASLRQMYAAEPNWTRQEMASIQTPVLVLDGIDEEVIDIDHVRVLAELLPNGELLLMPETGHFAMVDQSEEFTRIVVEYLDRTA
jgi:pimeloyl-ACP methyl ester carboxylesterase